MSGQSNTPSRALQVSWTTILAAGQLTLIGTIFLVSQRKGLACQSALLTNVLFSFLAAVTYSFLLYSSAASMDAKPPRDVCILQAILKHGVDQSSLASMAFLLAESFLGIRDLLHGTLSTKYIKFCRRIRAQFLWFNMAVWTLVTSLSIFINPDTSPTRFESTFYCALSNSILNTLDIDFVIVITACIGGIIVWIIVTLFKHGSELLSMLKEKDEMADDVRLFLHSAALSVLVTAFLIYDFGVQDGTALAQTLFLSIPLLTALILGSVIEPAWIRALRGFAVSKIRSLLAGFRGKGRKAQPVSPFISDLPLAMELTSARPIEVIREKQERNVVPNPTNRHQSPSCHVFDSRTATESALIQGNDAIQGSHGSVESPGSNTMEAGPREEQLPAYSDVPLIRIYPSTPAILITPPMESEEETQSSSARVAIDRGVGSVGSEWKS